MRQLETCGFKCKLLIIITLINLNKNAVCESWRLMVLKMQVINYNHIEPSHSVFVQGYQYDYN